MNDETIITQDAQETAAPTPEEQLLQMQQNSVPKEQYEKLENRFNTFVQNVANRTFIATGDEPSTPTEEERLQQYTADILDIKHHRVKGACEHVERLLRIDDYLTSHGKRSAFEPSNGTLTEECVDSADRVRDVLRDALEKSEGSDEVLMSHIQRRLADRR